ncbi:SWIM zinc finger family protein [Bacillus sp. FJAT-42376]|uniref:SWIM zinc finger family protein n=1 Tax=Bacillus sp. FJAT-42376 TaxID=2014076 RepID=UPI000F4D6583|nr:SWIM zinc finger family protein [Bacillus sp. FJAT-42376]
MLMRDLDKERVLLTAERLRTILSPADEEDRNLVKKGLILYRQGSVYNVNVSAERLTAKVQDVSPASITLDLDFVQASSCSCPADGFCRHLMAAFLYVYASVDRIGTFVDAWKDDRAAHVLSQMRRASELLNREFVLKEDSLESWHELFEREYEALQVKTMQGLYHQFFFKLKQKAPKKLELKRLFVIHLAIVTITRMLASYNRTKVKDPSLNHMAMVYVNHMANAIETELEEMKRYATPFALDPLLGASADYFRKLLEAPDPFYSTALDLYKLLWSGLMNRPKWLEMERKAFEAKQEDAVITAKDLMGMLHIDFLLKKDDAVLDYLKDGNIRLFPSSFLWLEEMMAKKQWDRLEKWLPYVMELSPQYVEADLPRKEIRNGAAFLLDVVGAYARAAKKDDLYEEACRTLLPYSYNEYENMLALDERYYEWAELNMLLGYPVYEVEERFLKEAEKAEPEAVLSLYKQTIYLEMEIRNRDSYKRAVRLLKKVKRLYKKMKSEEEWEDYLDMLQERYKRLRAFREELVKGKLIDG